MGEGRGHPCNVGGEGPGQLLSELVVVGIRCDMADPQEVVHRHRVARGRGTVVDLLGSDQQLLAIVGCEEKAPTRIIRESLHHRPVQRQCGGEVPVLEGGLVELQQTPHKESVVVEVPRGRRRPLAVAVGQATVPVEQRGEDEVRGTTGGVDQVWPLDDRAGLGQGSDHHAVPFRQDLVVEVGSNALAPGLEQAGSDVLQPALQLLHAHPHGPRQVLE